MSLEQPSAPDAISSRKVEARILRQKVWKQCNVENQHFMAAVVGREGTGKSYTSLKIAELCDPTFDAERVMFDPEAFLERLQEWKANGETKGKAVVVDEAGVGVGVRTWYDQDQIKFNQVLQVIRDENMAVFFTLPRLNELDSQARGRLHAFLEMVNKKDGEWAELKWKNVDPTRDERNDIYKKYPRLYVNGGRRRIKKLRFGPPSEELATEYEERKNEFQRNLYDEALQGMDDSEEVEQTAQDIADEIKESGDLSDVVSYHNGHHKWQFDKELIRAKYEISHSKAQTAKKLLSADGAIQADDADAQTEGDA